MNKETDALNDIRSRIAEAQGDEATATAIARAKELRDATSDAQRALLQQLYAIEDANAAQDKLTEAQEAAATAAEQLRQAWESVSDSLVDEVNRIRGLTGGDDAASFATLQGRFNEAVLAARGGDQEAAAKLAELSQSLLDVAGNVATSRQELERIKAETAASLEGVIDATKGYAGGSSSASSASATASTAIDAVSSATGTASASSSNDNTAELRAMRAEQAQMRADLNNGLAAIASGVNRSARVLEDVSAEADGRAIVVSGVAK
jgi:DNA repair exonuclease SbcCD ATPase subunit